MLPLLGSQLLPLRQFGIIFTIVTIISFWFAFGFFNALMMILGPLGTRANGAPEDTAAGTHATLSDDLLIQAAQNEVADEVAWELETEKARGDHITLFA